MKVRESMPRYYLFNQRTKTFLTDDNDQPVELTESKKESYDSLFKLIHINHLIFMDADELAIHDYNAQVLKRE